ncbi:MAG: shikimate kinase, partial [Planctomycetota bacterium]
MSASLPLRLSLAGYRATGKSVVAAELAHRVGYQVVDTDQRVVQLAGKSIAAIFDEDGEDTFRDLET